MYKLANGWTKETVMTQVKRYNNDTRAVGTKIDGNTCVYKTCLYQTNDGNRCAIGAFIPDGHPGLKSYSEVSNLLFHHPDLVKCMPFTDSIALKVFQRRHDELSGSVYTNIQNFLNNEVE